MTDVLETDEIRTGELLDGRYRLVERIGEGGMARVYRAEDTVLERTVAVKVLRGGVGDDESLARAHSETTLLAGLNHHSLVTLFDANIGEGSGGYLVMEHVDGITLRELIARGPVDPGELAAIAVDLAEGLHVAHRAGVVHRDIKPSNVLIWRSPIPGREWRAKLADFGIACLLDSARITMPGVVIGTMAYVAPEQARGAQASPPADIYAFGIMLIEALTGRRPFAEAEGIGAVMARLTAPPPIPETLDPTWRGLLRGMTAMNPEDRPSALEVAVTAGSLLTPEAPPAGVVVDEPTVAVAALDAPMASRSGGEAIASPAPVIAAPPELTMPSALPAQDPPTGPTTVFDPLPTGAAALLSDPVSSRRAARDEAAATGSGSRRRRLMLIVVLAIAALAIAAAVVVAFWSSTRGTLPEPTPAQTTVEEPAPSPSVPPVEEAPPAVEPVQGEDTGGGGDSGSGGGNDNSGPGNNNGNGNGNGNGNSGNGNGNG